MKRTLFPLLLAVLAMLFLAACGSAPQTASTSSASETLRREDTPKEPGSQAGAPASQDTSPFGAAQSIDDTMPLSLEALLMYMETRDNAFFTPHALTPSEQAALRADVEAQGGTVSFAPDGSFTIKSPGGGSITFAPDGSFSGQDDDGKSFGSAPASWPSGPLAGAVPQPDFAVSAAFEESGSLEVLFEDVTLAQAKAYGAQLKALFPLNTQETELAQYNMYAFSGENAAGLHADLTYMEQNGSANCALSVTDPALWKPDGEPFDPQNYDPQIYEGEALRYGDSWPKSGLLAMLPAPAFGDDLQVRDDRDKMTGTVYGATPADFDAYLKLVKDRGFTIDAEYEEDPHNYNLKLYTACNSAGNEVLVQYTDVPGAGGALGVIVTLPE